MERIQRIWSWITSWFRRSGGRRQDSGIYSHITTVQSRHPEAGSGNTEHTEDPDAERRQFLTKLSLGVSGLAALVVGIPVIGNIVAPAVREDPNLWRPVGSLDNFPVGKTVQVAFLDPEPLPWAGFAARTGAFVRQQPEGQFIALSMYCTHTGCPVRWEQNTQLFLCPCHGGTFHQDGSVAAGPPPTRLEQYPVRVGNGWVEIQTQPQPLPE